MRLPRTQLEQRVRDLQDRNVEDRASLAELSQTLWKLGRQAESVEAFRRLLPQEAAPVDPAFDEFYTSGLLATGTCATPVRRRDRLMRLIEMLRETRDLSGDVVECGCYLGLSSFMMCSYLKHWDNGFDGRGYHIFDSFEGLSEPTLDDEVPDDWAHADADAIRAMTRRGNFAASYERVSANLRDFPGITFHRGWIPLTFQGLPDVRYRFVHVDVDLFDPTLDCFEYFYSRLTRGGMIVSDDYGWPGARQAIDEFCERYAVKCVSTEFNQAVVRKLRDT